MVRLVPEGPAETSPPFLCAGTASQSDRHLRQKLRPVLVALQDLGGLLQDLLVSIGGGEESEGGEAGGDVITTDRASTSGEDEAASSGSIAAGTAMGLPLGLACGEGKGASHEDAATATPGLGAAAAAVITNPKTDPMEQYKALQLRFQQELFRRLVPQGEGGEGPSGREAVALALTKVREPGCRVRGGGIGGGLRDACTSRYYLGGGQQ